MEQGKEFNVNQSIDISLLKKEVDTLQIAMQEQRKPWFKNISTLISIIALFFSFGTTFVSYQRIQNQDIQNARAELRNLLQRIVSFPRENIEITKKYEKIDPNAMAIIGSSINQENTLLARQATEIANKIPSKYISATEYYSIGLALQNAYNLEGAKEFITKAINVSTDMNDRVGALRARANVLFLSGQPDAGRVDYQKALNIFNDFNSITYNDYIKKSTHIWTELAWAYSEANIRSINVALQHVQNAENLLSGLNATPESGIQQLKNQINQARTTIEKISLTNSSNVPQEFGLKSNIGNH
jgi:tetratricopeptide (TPR) repeat protein